jgi:hypothetical protein
MTECLPGLSRYVRQFSDNEWQGADHPDGPWRPIDLALRLQRLEAMRETEKFALLDAFRQIDELKQRLDFQYLKLNKLEESITPEAHD